jgi:hypothetical protein
LNERCARNGQVQTNFTPFHSFFPFITTRYARSRSGTLLSRAILKSGGRRLSSAGNSWGVSDRANPTLQIIGVLVLPTNLLVVITRLTAAFLWNAFASATRCFSRLVAPCLRASRLCTFSIIPRIRAQSCTRVKSRGNAQICTIAKALTVFAPPISHAKLRYL